jgi:hypothetical protein
MVVPFGRRTEMPFFVAALSEQRRGFWEETIRSWIVHYIGPV